MLASKDDLTSVRLIDFGLSRAMGAISRADAGRICGTPSCIAPEVIQGGPYSPAVDCWAAGVILYILLSGVVPFSVARRANAPDSDHRELFELFRRGD